MFDSAVIIIGADVNHPEGGNMIDPSFSALVSSYDYPRATKFSCIMKHQKCRTEVIQNLSQMIKYVNYR